MLCALLVIGGGAYVGYQYWHSEQLDRFLDNSSQGTLRLIAEGASRHQDKRQAQWLALSRRVTALPIEQLEHQRGPAGLTHLDNGHRQIQLPIPGDSGHWLIAQLQLADIDQQFLRGTQLLLLNELGRYPIKERKAALERLQTLFPYPLQWRTGTELKVNYLQKRTLARGDTVVDFVTADDGSRHMLSIAPIGNSGDFLQLGPVALFEPFPRYLVAGSGLLGMLLLAMAGFMLVRPLERRLALMATEVDRLEPGSSERQLTISGNDGLTSLAHKINAMSSRIHQLISAQRELNRAVSHELKTPLARLGFRRELALQKLQQLDSVDTSSVAQHLEGMDSSLQELNTLVEEILLYARLESAQPQLERAEYSPATLMNPLIKALEEQHPQLEFTICMDETLTLYGDQWQLRRALQNLLSNACRYASRQVQLSSWQTDNWLSVAIDDDGPGIPEALREKVLEPFFRVEGSRNRASGGTGLGLAIVNQILQWHGGRLSIDQTDSGGTRALLRLPAAPADATRHDNRTVTN